MQRLNSPFCSFFSKEANEGESFRFQVLQIYRIIYAAYLSILAKYALQLFFAVLIWTLICLKCYIIISHNQAKYYLMFKGKSSTRTL